MIAYGIGLGSNLGDREGHLREGMRRLLTALPEAQLKAQAGLYETEPVDCAPGSKAFLNSVVEIESSLRPETVYTKLAEIERALGRPVERGRNVPRTLDLDVLYAGDWVSKDPALMVPHPRLGERRFVLKPLAEIRPDLLLPGFDRTISELLDRLQDDPSAVVKIRTKWG